MVHVLATIQLQPEKRAEFLQELAKLVPLVRAEKGCIEYGPAVDVQTAIPNQPPGRPDVVTMIEKWADIPALEAHLVAPHMVEYRTRVKSLVLAVELRILEPV